MKKSMLTAAACVSAAALAIAGCAQAPGTNPASAASGSAGASVAAGSFKACMVSDSGGFDDKSFNETSYNGLVKAEKELSIPTQKIESTSNADYAKNIQAMIDAKCSVIVTVGFALADATVAAATKNPSINFAIVDSGSSKEALPNHKGLLFNTAESSFMAGYLAAGMTKTGKVATFGGAKYPTVTIFMDGFSQGVEYYNQQKSKSIQVLGWDRAKQDGQFVPGNNPFENQAGGKETASALTALGADVIFPVAGPAGLGGLEVASGSGGKVNAIWVDTDGFLSTKYGAQIISSVYKGMDIAVFDAIKDAKDGKFSKDPFVGTLKNAGTGLAPFHDFDSKVPADLKSELNTIKADIESGKIKIDSAAQPK